MSRKESFYLAPLQGITDYIFRKSYHKIFGDIDEYYIPYISSGPGGKIKNSQYRDILPENNDGVPVVPQILCGNVDELKQLAIELKNFGYQKVNLNLGCPYPMATNRGRGTALLENEEALKQVLDVLFNEFEFTVSAKFRSGLTGEQTIFDRIALLSSYPFDKLIYHPRTANQLYKGTANRQLFAELSKVVQKPLVYNGDIQTIEDINELKALVPDQNEWMIGRGILTDPLLIRKLSGEIPSAETEKELKWQLHQQMLETYLELIQDKGHVLIKMKQFWSYFSGSFSNPAKAYKPIKKAGKLAKFMEAYPTVFKNF